MLLINLDTDQHARLARDYGVTSVPTMKVFEQREVVDTLHDLHLQPAQRRVLSQYVAQASDGAIGRALLLITLPLDQRTDARVQEMLTHLNFILTG